MTLYLLGFALATQVAQIADGLSGGLRSGPRLALDSARVSRFSEPQDPAFQRLNTSLGFDRRLWPYDVAQSRAHARMLAAPAIIAEDDRDALLAGLDAVEAELDGGHVPVRAPTTRTSTWRSSGG